MLKIIIMVTCIFFLVNCTSYITDPLKNYTVQDYFPTKEGSTWIYTFYDHEGNPRYGDDFEPFIKPFSIIESVENEDGDVNCIIEILGGGSMGSEPGVWFNPPISFISPGYRADVTDTIVIQYLEEYISFDSITDIQLYSVPNRVYSDPIFSAEEKTISFTHQDPFQSNCDYELLFRTYFQNNGSPDSLFHSWDITTKPRTFSCSTHIDSCFVSDDVLYSYCSFVFNGFFIEIKQYRLKTPFEVGNQWVLFLENGQQFHDYFAKITDICSMTIEGTEYKNVLKIENNNTSDIDWYAPHIGLVMKQTSKYVAKLICYQD